MGRQKFVARTLSPFLVSISIYLILASMAIQKPMAGDDLYTLEEARGYETGTYRVFALGHDLTFEHVPLYSLCLAFLRRLFGENIIVFRSVGVVSLCFVLFLLSRYPFLVLPNSQWAKRVAWIAPLLVATHPAAVQASVALVWDSTLFPPFFTLFCLVWLATSVSTTVSLIGLSSLYGLCLWTRTTSSLILPVSWLIWIFLFRPQRKEALHLFIVFLGRLLLFAVSWTIFVFFTWGPAHLWTPFTYLVGKFGKPYSLEDRIQDFVRFLFWFGIPWLVLFTVSLLKRIPESLLPCKDRLNFLRVVIFLGIPVYCVTTTSSWGYPKFLTPFIPIATFFFVSLLTEGWPVFKRKESVSLCLLSGAVLLLAFFFIKDPLYELCYALKKSLMLGLSLGKEFPRILWLFGFPSLLLLATLWTTGRLVKGRVGFFSSLTLGCCVATFSMQLPFAALQAHAPYPTISLYGDREKGQVIALLKQKIPPEALILAPELTIVYEAGNRAKYLGGPSWHDPAAFLNTLRTEDPQVVVYSFSTLSIHSYRKVVQDPEVQEELKRRFTQRTIGDYTLWFRREK